MCLVIYIYDEIYKCNEGNLSIQAMQVTDKSITMYEPNDIHLINYMRCNVVS